MVEPARTATGRTRSAVLAAVLVVSTVLVGVLVYPSLASSSSSAASPTDVLAAPDAGGRGPGDPGAPSAADGVVPDGTTAHRSARPAAVTEADGVVPEGTTVFDGRIPAVANLNPALLRALQQAATDAARVGVQFFVDSGWRSAKYQEQLFRQAIAKYGSAEKAARWVAAPGTSTHETGNAVDIGHADATTWLSEHGAAYGLCQTYSNEPWHYELRPSAVDHGCPPMYADPTHDPRLQQ